jgi:hypothetical protein
MRQAGHAFHLVSLGAYTVILYTGIVDRVPNTNGYTMNLAGQSGQAGQDGRDGRDSREFPISRCPPSKQINANSISRAEKEKSRSAHDSSKQINANSFSKI